MQDAPRAGWEREEWTGQEGEEEADLTLGGGVGDQRQPGLGEPTEKEQRKEME